jgi:hypothetical protein
VDTVENKVDELANDERRAASEPEQPQGPEFIGSDKKIVFGGETSGQIHIPAGLREPDKGENPA